MNLLRRLLRSAASELGELTKDDWLGSDPSPMFDALRGKASDRKLRLFASACCRAIPESRLCWVYADAGAGAREWERVLDVSDHAADGIASADELDAAIRLATRVDEAEAWQSDRASSTATALVLAVTMLPDAFDAAKRCAHHAAAAHDAFRPARAAQADLLREIFGMRPGAMETLTCGEAVKSLASSIYEAWAFDRLPQLAAAVEREGMSNTELVTHLRSPAGHVRGCWALDLVLGRH